MIVRIVKMTFQPSLTTDFLNDFNSVKEKIRGFEGCSYLELYQDKKDPTVFFTYSHWTSEAALEKYRQSGLFRTVWQKTKVKFSQTPEAWSVESRALVP